MILPHCVLTSMLWTSPVSLSFDTYLMYSSDVIIFLFCHAFNPLKPLFFKHTSDISFLLYYTVSYCCCCYQQHYLPSLLLSTKLFIFTIVINSTILSSLLLLTALSDFNIVINNTILSSLLLLTALFCLHYCY